MRADVNPREYAAAWDAIFVEVERLRPGITAIYRMASRDAHNVMPIIGLDCDKVRKHMDSVVEELHAIKKLCAIESYFASHHNPVPVHEGPTQ